MDIFGVADIIARIADGFAGSCVRCLTEHSGNIIRAIQEQMYGGLNGKEECLSPTYDDDPFFEQEGQWKHRNEAYKKWKMEITPPMRGPLLDLSPRPENVPNLCINATFYNQLRAVPEADGIFISPGDGNGPDIVRKFGDDILDIGPTAAEYFNREFMLPSIGEFFKDCGYV